MGSTALLVIVVATALACDFTNGFHDAANAIATAIATGALRPRLAVLFSASPCSTSNGHRGEAGR
jgi:inorganic phosphate transporter, PiT family